jgi:hypothetical protein
MFEFYSSAASPTLAEGHLSGAHGMINPLLCH